MLGCHNVSQDLTAWIEGELPERRCDCIREHLTACARCSAEADSLRLAIAWQQRALRAVTSVHGIATVALRARLRLDIAAEAEERTLLGRWRHAWVPMWGRLALAGAAFSLAVVALLLAGGPAMVLMPLGLESPPAAVVQHTELFKDYPLIERLDVLEHFDTVESIPLDDESAAQRG
jgi:anti-sigma factor RsiW